MIALLSRLFSRREPVLSEATPQDAAAIAKLHAASFNRGWSEDEIDRLMLERNVLTHRATVNGRLVGFIISRIAAGEAEILSVAVATSYRRKGLARRMLNLHMGRLAGSGTRVLFLEVDEGNAAACQLYRRAGFREAGRREGYYTMADGKRATALVLRRDLT
ncbi:MAG: ribosomal-protein-alanine N-acetyltransferase [Rhizobiales bacterium]|nr:ribosomal-protein-alanine N-acetyltransferase [Hyphomicrobiales bacterium]